MEETLAAIGVVLVMLVLVGRNADCQDRVSARRGRALAKGGCVVWLVVVTVISRMLSLVAGVDCIAGLRCAGTEHAGMDWGSCVSFVFQRMASEVVMEIIVSYVEGLVGNGCWMNAG
jgi:hypothetical protein